MSPALQALVALAVTGWGAFAVSVSVARVWRARYELASEQAREMEQRASRWMVRAVRAEGDDGHYAFPEADGFGAPPRAGVES